MTSNIPGVQLIENISASDERGFTTKSYDRLHFELQVDQILISHNSKAGTVRGMHFQVDPNAERKLVTCISGEIIDFVLDMRPNSPSFMQISQFHLDSPKLSLFIPEMVAHGYQTLCNNSTVQYAISGKYSEDCSRIVNIFDPKLDIDLPLEMSEISTRDKHAPFI